MKTLFLSQPKIARENLSRKKAEGVKCTFFTLDLNCAKIGSYGLGIVRQFKGHLASAS